MLLLGGRTPLKVFRIILRLISGLMVVIALMFSIICYSRTKLPYNSQGNYFDIESATVYHEQAGISYGFLSVVFLLLTVLLVLALILTHTKKRDVNKSKEN